MSPLLAPPPAFPPLPLSPGCTASQQQGRPLPAAQRACRAEQALLQLTLPAIGLQLRTPHPTPPHPPPTPAPPPFLTPPPLPPPLPAGERIKPVVWGCCCLALLGTGLLEAGGGSPPNLGDALSVFSALAFALQLFRTEGLSRQLGRCGAWAGGGGLWVGV